MAVPAPAIPTGNAYTVNVARPSVASSPLPVFAAAAARLLATWKIPVRMHVSGTDAAAMSLRETLATCGARASAFSPAPFPDRPEIPGEGFWKTSFVIVDTVDGSDCFWAAERPERKVGWDPLLAALTEGEATRASGPALRRADLWIVRSDSAGDLRAQATAWRAAGAAAVTVLGVAGAAWSSGSAVFGRSEGVASFDSPADAHTAGLFAAGVVTGLFHDLLGENLFDKTLLRIERECLAMRPLRLGRAVESGAAACLAAYADGSANLSGSGSPDAEPGIFAPPGGSAAGSVPEFLRRPGAFATRYREVLRERRGPESKPWAHKGR